jgi:inactivated superfamily I helicase
MTFDTQPVSGTAPDALPEAAPARTGVPMQDISPDAAAPTPLESVTPGVPTQGISPALEAAATQALGGVPTRPPLMMAAMPAPIPEAPGLAALRQAFTDSQLPPTAPAPLGHSLFDAPATSADRAAKVATVRSGLAELARAILSAEAALTPIIEELTKDGTVKLAEKFQPRLAAKLLTDLKGVITELLPKEER